MLIRKVNVDRYDDRDIVDVNLVAAYDRLMDFARKHLPDPFYLEGDVRISLREIIVREMVSNVLIHREFTSSRPARFVIEQNQMFVENACRAASGDVLTPDNLQPFPRNPIVASFFREIAYADQLGSGVRNLFKYSKAYGGADPTIKDGDIFRITVLLKTSEVAPIGVEVAPIGAEVDQKLEGAATMLADKVRGDGAENAIKVLKALMSNCKMAIPEMERMTGLSNGSVKNAIRLLRLNGMIRHEGKSRGGEWVVLV